MSAKHTPGPWTVKTVINEEEGEVSAIEEWRIEYPGGGGCWLATVHVGACASSGELAEEAANASLIAAAPDLLAALKDLDACYCEASDDMSRAQRDHHRKVIVAAREAVTKATAIPSIAGE